MKHTKHHFAIDLDGTLLEYTGWVDQDHFGKPFPETINWVKNRLLEGHKITILTARTNHEAVKNYLLSQGFPELDVTSTKSNLFSLIIDDRALRFDDPNLWKNTLDKFPNIQPWWKPT